MTESKQALENAWSLKFKRSEWHIMLAERMQKVVEKEQALADKEEASRRNDKNVQKKLRRLRRRETESTERVGQALKSPLGK